MGVPGPALRQRRARNRNHAWSKASRSNHEPGWEGDFPAIGEGRPPPRGDERRGGEDADAQANESAMTEQSAGPRCDGDDEGARGVVNGRVGDCVTR